jgi:uncharacterized protein YbjT (DUF2867 family)
VIVLLFGATGNAGGSILHACLADPAVTEVRAVVRRPLPVAHQKLRAVVQQDFLDYSAIREAFQGVDACFFCLGISVGQVSGEAEYRRITRDFALAAADTLRRESPGAHFHYLSGAGAKLGSRMMWARVKAEAEQALREGVQATCWRPAFIDGADSRSTPRLYQWTRPAFRLLRFARGAYLAGEDLGRAMLRATTPGMRGRVIENREIRDLADAARVQGPTRPGR